MSRAVREVAFAGKNPPCPSSWHRFRKDSPSATIPVLSGELLALCPAVSGECHCHWALSLHCHSHVLFSGYRCGDLPQNVSSWLCFLSPTNLIPAHLCFNKRVTKVESALPIYLSPPLFPLNFISNPAGADQDPSPFWSYWNISEVSEWKMGLKMHQADLPRAWLCISPSLFHAQGAVRCGERGHREAPAAGRDEGDDTEAV